MPQPVHTWKNLHASVGMVSGFAVEQNGQVMTDSRIIVLPGEAIGGYALSFVELLAVETERDQPETEDQRRDQHVVGLGSPSRQSDRAEQNRQ